MDKALIDIGYLQVNDYLPPRGEEIILGKSENGVFNCFYTEISKPFKRDGVDCFYYRKDNEFHVLSSDMYWKNI